VTNVSKFVKVYDKGGHFFYFHDRQSGAIIHYSMKLNTKILLFFFALGIQFAYSQNKMDQGDKLKDLLRMLDNYYVDSFDKEKLVDAAITKMLDELDPHSSYIKNKDVKKVEEPLVGNFEGIGVTFQIWKDTIMINEVISGGPAQKVGLMDGDRIVFIDDSLVADIKIDNDGVVKRLRGKKGTKVKVGVVRRSSKEMLTFVITRDKIPVYSIEASYMVSPTTGYIKLIRFSATTMNEFRKASEKLRSQGMQNLIMDLQGNSGGYLTTAIQLCNEFIADEKQLIVFTKGLRSNREEYESDGKGNFKEGKLIVLIDEGSASASEIFAGCVQDIDRGLIIGRRTFGKGLVQKPYYFADGSITRLTVAHYHTPTGRSIQRPYTEGKKDYYDEYSKRVKTGELFGSDTFHYPDSLLFYTKNKRKVYGGGGVIPEIFIPIDTSLNSEYYQKIRRKGVLNSFCLEYVDQNRSNLHNTYPDAVSFIQNFDPAKNGVVELLFKRGEQDSIARDSEQINRSMPLFVNQTKSLIARNLFDNNTFWQVANESNESFKKALEVMESDQFSILNPPSRKELRKIERALKEKKSKR
jgi:carboxyl-terminal processing protease